MRDFSYEKASSTELAVSATQRSKSSKFLGGGTNLLDLMREDIEQPAHLVDVTGLSSSVEETPDGGLLIGAAASNTSVANDARVKTRYPILSQAILHGASGQIRNMATVGGNLLQRTRCYYFYEKSCRCNKRERGAGCDALEGFNRIHAILGASPSCIATHPSDMAVALAALEATVRLQGPEGEREIPFEKLHRLPAHTPDVETSLGPSELITAVILPSLPFAKRARYTKVRDRSSFAFALVSVAAMIKLEGETVGDVRLALGGVAHKPWRALMAEKALLGAPASEESFRLAAEMELAAARGHGHNDFKIALARNVIVETLLELTKETTR